MPAKFTDVWPLAMAAKASNPPARCSGGAAWQLADLHDSCPIITDATGWLHFGSA
jgi:hypothetical protein